MMSFLIGTNIASELRKPPEGVLQEVVIAPGLSVGTRRQRGRVRTTSQIAKVKGTSHSPCRPPTTRVLTMNFLKYLHKKWDDWCGDREMEMSIRKHLSQHGYFGDTAKLESVRLAAIQRPGWLQVFRFKVVARVKLDDAPSAAAEEGGPDEPKYETLFGLVREDLRHNRSNVRVFPTESERTEVFERWSEGLIQLRGATR